MARTLHVALALPGPYPTLPVTANALDLVMTAADATEKERVVLTGKQIVVWHNTGVSSRTVTITSIADGTLKRTGDIGAYTVGAGEYGAFGPVALEGFKQSSGELYFEASHADVKFGVLTIP